MRSRSIRSFIFLLSLIMLFGSIQIVQAEPAPDKLVVNHETKECATIFGGDECMDCLPPEGWEVLGWSYQVECPEGYSITEVEENCAPYKNEFCCTEGHSGAQGDCNDLVMNEAEAMCAFVDDINACHLPADWESTPGESEWTCPGNFTWRDDLECLDEPEADPESASGRLPLRCGGFALGVFLLGSLFTIKIERRT